MMFPLTRIPGRRAARPPFRRLAAAETLESRSLMAADALPALIGPLEPPAEMVPEERLAADIATKEDYSAIVFVGGWGSSMYQYAHSDPISALPAGEGDVVAADPRDVDRVLADEFAAGEDSGPSTVSDDVIIDGRIITGENFDSAATSAVDDLAVEEEDPTTIASHGYIRVMKLNTGG